MSESETMLSRERLLIGDSGIERLKSAHVVICGVGGVGSYVAEALARCGVGHLTVIDFDCYVVSNINRQLHALHSTLGRRKAEVVAERIADINPECRVDVCAEFLSADNAAALIDWSCDYIVDAIDSMNGKVAVTRFAYEQGIPIICAMGAGRRLDPMKLKIADISKTSVCPLARNFRRELRLVGISSGVEAVFSEEHPCEQHCGEAGVIGSMIFVPAAMGLLMASRVTECLLASADMK